MVEDSDAELIVDVGDPSVVRCGTTESVLLVLLLLLLVLSFISIGAGCLRPLSRFPDLSFGTAVVVVVVGVDELGVVGGVHRQRGHHCWSK